MGLWTGNDPEDIVLTEIWHGTYVLPYGCLREILPMIPRDAEVTTHFTSKSMVTFKGCIPLYDYQSEAVDTMVRARYGILRSPAGSGKTQMGLAIACKLGRRTLWLTHTVDLLIQSRDRAAQYLNPDDLGTIVAGKVTIGNAITFATVQTMSHLDLSQYVALWDCVIVDECHRVCTSPTSVTQFGKVLNSLSARHKYGLSATVHRADGLIRTTYAMLGQIVYTVPDEAVSKKTMRVSISVIGTGIGISPECLNTDGTLNYTGMISYLANCDDRNQLIVNYLIANSEHYNLILSTRIGHLEAMMRMLPPELQEQAVLITGKMTSKSEKVKRQQAIEDMRAGKKRYLFASYSLAKEGLDIPRLDRLYLTIPQKDYAIIVQSVGRIARTFDCKPEPIAYDFVDRIPSLQKAYKQRLRSYKSAGCKLP